MYEDEPQDRVHDVLAEAVFGAHPLGRRVLGEAEVIASIPVPDIESYHRARYTGSEIVVGAAGHLDHGRDRRAGRALRHRAGRRRREWRPTRRSTEAARLCFHDQGDRAVPHLLRRARACAATTSAATRWPCSTRSSAARPPPGSSARCARSAASPTRSAPTTSSSPTQGLVATYVGTREDNVEEACSIIGTELARLRSEPVSAEELARAKESVKGRLVLSSESTAARMTRISRATLFGLPIESLDEMLAKVDAVEVDDLTELAAELYGADRLSAACVGADEDRFRAGAGAGQREPGRGVIRVAVAGAAGRMGEAVCEAVEGAEDIELAGRADPAPRRRARRGARRGRRRRRLHHPRHRARQRPRLPGGRRPRRRRHHRLRPRRGRGRRRGVRAPTASSPPTSRSAPCC